MGWDPRDWDAGDWKRAGLDAVTGGQYETYRALNGQSSLYDKIPGVSSITSPAEADLTGVKAAQEKAFGLTDALAKERADYTGAYNPALGAENLQALSDAAAGKVASPAELMLKRQAAENAAG